MNAQGIFCNKSNVCSSKWKINKFTWGFLIPNNEAFLWCFSSSINPEIVKSSACKYLGMYNFFSNQTLNNSHTYTSYMHSNFFFFQIFCDFRTVAILKVVSSWKQKYRISKIKIKQPSTFQFMYDNTWLVRDAIFLKSHFCT